MRPTPDSCRLQQSTIGDGDGLWEQVLCLPEWRRVLGSAPLSVTVDGPGCRLRAADDRIRTDLGDLAPGSSRTIESTSLWHWLWVEGPTGVRVRWESPVVVSLPPVIAVIPTYLREDDACAQVRRLLEIDEVSLILVIDQGGTLADHPAFQAVQARASTRIELICQPNLGGSGGYARGMLASLDHPECAVLLGDDDAILTAESLRRMLTAQSLAAATGRRVIVGAPLFSARHPERLLIHTEAVDRHQFQWRPASGMNGPIDVHRTDPIHWSVLRPRRPADYTGWWATLLPPGTVAELGLPAPFFLKWDDAEYGLRATEHGYEHLVLPGTAVHHPPWSSHTTQMSWVGQILHRNRLAAAAAHGAGPGVVLSSLVHQIKHVLSGHHLTAHLWAEGTAQMLAGPAWLSGALTRTREHAQDTVDRWREAHRASASRVAELHARAETRRPMPLRGTLRAVRRLAGLPSRRAQVTRVSTRDLSWRTTLGADAVVIMTARSAPIELLVPSGAEDRALLARILRQHLVLLLRWPSLRRCYRRALRQSTTPQAWHAVLGTEPEGRP